MRQWIKCHRGAVLGLAAGTILLFGWLIRHYLDLRDTILQYREWVTFGTEA